MKFEREFKEAVINLPEKEKDKLLLRLLKKDDILAKQLHFELVGFKSKEESREEMEEIVKQKVEKMSRSFHNIGYLLMEIRSLSGEITEHVKVTKDKIGEITLNLVMLQEVLKRNTSRIQQFRFGKTEKFSVYIIVRTFKILVLIKAQHEDLQVDFNDDLQKLGRLLSDNDFLMRTAIHHGLDVNWLIRCDIPDDIISIQKVLKKNGYLK